jgi:Protein of unknown function (DUF1634)
MNTLELSLLIWLGSLPTGFLGALTGLGGGCPRPPLDAGLQGRHPLRYRRLVDFCDRHFLRGSRCLRERGLHQQLGLLLLVTTPLTRVVFSVVAFAYQRDRTHVVITCIALAVLLYSLTSGYL